MSSLIGHQTQRNALAALVREERLPSSLLFGGAAGIGKKLVALELAKHLLCESGSTQSLGGCRTCQACRLTLVGNHPDLRVLECSDDDMSVDSLRETLERLSLRPFMGRRKVTLINDADLLSIVGANILLKTLEEPRPENFFILIATTPSRLPQTVLSRCQRWFFDRLSAADVETIVRDRGGSDDDLALIPLADGSVAALDAIRSKGSIGDDIKGVLEAAWRGDAARVTQAAQDWGANKGNIAGVLAFLRAAIRQKLLDSSADRNASAVWATALQNALDAEYLVLERNTNATLALFHVLRSCDRGLAETYQVTPNSKPTLLELVSA